MKWLSKFDYIAPQIELTYKTSSLKRSVVFEYPYQYFCLILCNLIWKRYSRKEKPHYTITKSFINKSLVLQKDMPIALFIDDQTGNIHTQDFLEYLHFQPMYYEVRYNEIQLGLYYNNFDMDPPFL